MKQGICGLDMGNLGTSQYTCGFGGHTHNRSSSSE